MSTAISSRFDMEIFLMGDMKLDFVSFLSDCFGDNFAETLSWGNFRRFQLMVPSKERRLSVYFILLSNEQSVDLIINNFKMYEKRSLLLMLYNINEQKSEKHVDSLINTFLFERDKVYEGIFNKEIMEQNIKKISVSSMKIDEGELKKNLSFLTNYEGNLIYKIGFLPNLVNKKTKSYKKNTTTNSNEGLLYDLNQEIFYMTIEGEDVKINFEGLLNYLVKEHFKLLKIENKYKKYEIGKKEKDDKKKNKDITGSNTKGIAKGINFLIVLYIAIAIYKYFE